MSPIRILIALVLVAPVVTVRAESPAAADPAAHERDAWDDAREVAAMMRAALEAHAAPPPEPPRLPDATDLPPARATDEEDGAGAPRRRGEVRREALDRAISHAADAAQDAIERARDRGPASAGRRVDAESEAAVGLGRAAETRGFEPPVPIVPPVNPRGP